MILKISGLIESIGAKALLAFIFTALATAIGQNLLAYEVLFILVILDTITGVMKGFKHKNLNSRKFRDTAHKIILYSILIISAHQLVRLTPMLQWFEDFVVVYLAVTEVLSIIENAHVLGVVLPEWVSEKLCRYLGHEAPASK